MVPFTANGAFVRRIPSPFEELGFHFLHGSVAVIICLGFVHRDDNWIKTKRRFLNRALRSRLPLSDPLHPLEMAALGQTAIKATYPSTQPHLARPLNVTLLVLVGKDENKRWPHEPLSPAWCLATCAR